MLQGHTSPVHSITLTSDNKYLVSGSGSLNLTLSTGTDNTVRIWSLKQKKEIAALEGHYDVVSSVAVTSDNKYIVSGSFDTILRRWTLQDKIEKAILPG